MVPIDVTAKQLVADFAAGNSYSQIAKSYRMTRNAVAGRLFRAKKAEAKKQIAKGLRVGLNGEPRQAQT